MYLDPTSHKKCRYWPYPGMALSSSIRLLQNRCQQPMTLATAEVTPMTVLTTRLCERLVRLVTHTHGVACHLQISRIPA